MAGPGVRFRLGPHAGHITTGLRLGETESGSHLAAGDTGQVPLLLVVISRDQHRTHGKPGQQQHEGGRIRVLRHLLDGHGETEDSGTRATEFSGQAEAEEVRITECLEDVHRILPGGVDLPGTRFDLVLGQPPNALLEGG